MKVTLHTISPLHIGTGEDLSALDYVIQGNEYFRISQKTFLDYLQTKNIDLITEYSEWLIGITAQLEELETVGTFNGKRLEGRDKNQTRSKLKKDITLLNFFSGKRQTYRNEFIQFLRQHSEVKKYKINGNTKQQIRGLITDGLHRPYLPGSSIKGAIRTALLYNTLNKYGQHYQKGIEDAVKRLLEEKDNPQRLAKRIAKPLEQIAFCGEKKKRHDSFVIDYSNIQLDIFKFLTVSDAIMKNTPLQAVEVISTDLYLIGKEESGNRNSQIMAMKQPQAPGVEAIKANTDFNFDIHFQLPQLFAIYQKLKKTDNERTTWIKIEEKVLHVFGINLQEVTLNNLSDQQKKVEDYIWTSMIEFAKAQIIFEEKWLENYLTKPISREIGISKAEFKTDFTPIFRYPFQQNSLLRVGFATGFANSTEFLYFLKTPALHNLMHAIMKKVNIGSPRQSKGKSYEPDIFQFPKSRMFASPKSGVCPLGWVELIRTETQTTEIGKIPEIEKVAATPIFASKKVKIGDTIDGVLIKSEGKIKTFRLYLDNGNTQEASVNYFADLPLQKVYNIRVNSMNKDGIILSFIPMGEKG